MTKKITTYDELLLEKARLQALMKMQKEQIHQDFREIKEELAPVKNILGVVSKFTSRETGGNLLLTGTTNTIIDFILKKFVLARTGWFTRVVVPYLVKNYASHFMSTDKKNNIIQKIASFFRKKPSANGNGKMHHAVDEEK